MSRFLLVAVLLAAAPALAQPVSRSPGRPFPTPPLFAFEGTLAAGDSTIVGTGEFSDAFEVPVAAGQTIRAVVTSADFDTWLIVRPPTGEPLDDDDCTPGDTSSSCLTLVADTAGVVRVTVTSYRTGETGRYRLEVRDVPAGAAAVAPR